MRGELVALITSDGLELPGFFVKSAKKTKKCIIFVHGLKSNFLTDNLVKTMGEILPKFGYNFLAFNNRGSGVITGFRSKKKKYHHINIGGSKENFKDCIKDIKAAINYAKKYGSKEIILVGHSTGCQKSVFYQFITNDKRIKGIILLAPASDITYEKKKLGKKYKKEIQKAKKLLKEGKKDQLMGWENLAPERYLSLNDEKSIEANLFNYNNPKRMKLISKIKVPIFAVYGSKDKYSVYGTKKELEIIGEKVKSKYSCAIIKGASHGFDGKEKILVKFLVRQLKKW